jgi:hypothetical protein
MAMSVNASLISLELRTFIQSTPFTARLGTPAICGSRVYLRVAKRGENCEEFLYCVGNAASQTR